MLSNLKWGYVIKVKRVNLMLNIIVNTILQNTSLLYFKLISIFIGFRVKWGKPHLTYLPMGFCIFNGRLTLILIPKSHHNCVFGHVLMLITFYVSIST